MITCLFRNVNNESQSELEICKKYSAIIGNHVYLIKNNKKELVECIDINENGNLIIKENTLISLIMGFINKNEEK